MNTIKCNGDTIRNSEMADHLGHISSASDEHSIISAAIASFWKAFSLLISDIGGLYSFIKSQLFKQYSSSFYGSYLWFCKKYNML